MEPTQEQTQKSSHTVLIIGIVAIVIIIAAATAVVLLQPHKKEVAKKTTAKQSTKVATKTDVQQALANVSTTIKQAATDQATAKAAIQSGTNQVKVGN
jgi:uncharacterized protein YpmS